MEIIKIPKNPFPLEQLSCENLTFNETVKFIKYGKNHIIIVTTNNDIFSYGNNYYGQCGIQTYELGLKEFTKVDEIDKTIINNITYLYCGKFTSIFINNFNEIYISGKINIRHLKSTFFSKIIFLNKNIYEKIKFVKGEWKYRYLLTENNELYQVGNYNKQDNLQNDGKVRMSLKQININFIVKDLQCGDRHCVILDTLQNIYVIGDNEFGELGTRDYKEREKFTKIKFSFKVNKISCEYSNTFILNEFNELFGTGMNSDGQLGLKKSNNNNINTFTKIVIKGISKINDIYTSYNYYNIISSIDNLLFINYKNKFINFGKISGKYIYPVLLRDYIFLFKSDCAINCNDNKLEEIYLGLKCFNKVNCNRLTDINIQ